MSTSVAGDMDFLDIRRALKERIRKANNMESYSADDTREAKTSSLFGPSETSLSQRLINESKTLVPEMVKILEKMDNNDHPKPNSNVDLKGRQGCKKLRDYSRDYSFLNSESAQVPKNSKPRFGGASSKADENGITKKSLPIPKADRNGIPKKRRNMVSSLKPKKSGDHKDKISSGKPESVQKDSVPVSGSKSLNSRPRENNVVTKSQASSAKESVCPKQAEVSNTKPVPRNEGPSLKRKLIEKHRVEKDYLEDDDSVDISSVIQDIFGRRGKRRYTNHGDYDDDRAMVSGFRDILKEENRSARIAREEDAIEALRLEQEAKKERLSKAKKPKLMN